MVIRTPNPRADVVNIAALIEAGHTKSGRVRATGGLVTALRHAAERFGPVAPFGAGNEKTGSFGNYGGIARTCPTTCPHHPLRGATCYGLYGNVALHERRAATYDTAARLRAVACCAVGAALRGQRFRLDVVGDKGDGHNGVNWSYLFGAASLVVATLEALPDAPNPLGWSYTAIPSEVLPDHVLDSIASAGLVIRRSNRVGPRGAITYPFARIEALKAEYPGQAFVKCPAQLVETVSCSTCPVCVKARGTVVFDPHGVKAKAASRNALNQTPNHKEG